MGCIFCGKVCRERDIEGGYEENIPEGRIIGHTHICIDCLQELKDILEIENMEKEIAELECEILDDPGRLTKQ